jgi:hypothetical protein
MSTGQKIMQAVVIDRPAMTDGQMALQLSLFNPDGTPATVTPQTGANVKLTGFTTGAAGAVAATDTINQAIAKLQARIVALEAA